MERKLHETDLNTFSCEAFQIFAEAPLLTAGGGSASPAAAFVLYP